MQVRFLSLLLLLLISFQSYTQEEIEDDAAADLTTRMYFFNEMANELHTVCFPEGDFVGNVIFHQPDVSIHETIIDCPEQLAALHDEMEAIDALIEEHPEITCTQEDTMRTADELVGGMDEVLTMQNMCEESRNESMRSCMGSVTCAVAKLISTNVITDTAVNLGCNAAGVNMDQDRCRPNAGAGIAYSLSDTLALFGLGFMGEQEAPTQEQIDAANETAELATVHQSDASVRSFSSNPAAWAYDVANSILNSMKDSIMNRFGCDEWEGDPYMSSCKRPVSWSCANCAQRTNMVCGTLGYVLGLGLQEIATAGSVGAAVGAARVGGGLIARASARIATRARRFFPANNARRVGIIGRSFGRAMRIGGLAATRLRQVWTAMKNSVPVQSIRNVAAEVKNRIGQGVEAVSAWRASARQRMVYAVTEDAITGPFRLMFNAAKRYNELSEQAFNYGYNATSRAKVRGVNMLRNDPNSPLVSDITSGVYTDANGNPLRSPEEYFNYRFGEAENFDDLSYVVSNDGRMTVVSRERADFNNPISVGEINTATPPQTAANRIDDFTYNPAAGAGAADNVVESTPIVVTGNRQDAIAELRRNEETIRGITGPETSEDVIDVILDGRRTYPEETLDEFVQRRTEVIDGLKDGLGLSDEAALAKYDELVEAGVITERAPASVTDLGAEQLVDQSNRTAAQLDETLTLYVRNEETVPELISTIQRGGNIDGVPVTSLDDFFRARNVPPQQQRNIRELWDETTAQRARLMDQNISDDLARLRDRNAEITPIDCDRLSSLNNYSGAFAGQCHRIRLTQASRGDYCTCNTRATNALPDNYQFRRPGPWMLPCSDVAQYMTSRRQADLTALPAKAINRCWRVELPRDTVCYHGGLSPTFSGFGGLSQMACVDETSRAKIADEINLGVLDRKTKTRGAPRPGIEDPNSPDYIEGLNLPDPNHVSDWRILNWSPISDDPNVLRITARARECFNGGNGGQAGATCSPETLREIRRMIDEGNFSDFDKGELEQYYQYLRGDIQLDPKIGYPYCIRNGQRVYAFSPTDCMNVDATPGGRNVSGNELGGLRVSSRTSGDVTTTITPAPEFERAQSIYTNALANPDNITAEMRIQFRNNMASAGDRFEREAKALGMSQASSARREAKHNAQDAIASYVMAGDDTGVVRMIDYAMENGLFESLQVSRMMARIGATLREGGPLMPQARAAFNKLQARCREIFGEGYEQISTDAQPDEEPQES